MAKGLSDLFKQAKQLESLIMKIQKDLGEKVVTGSSGGGMVRVTINGSREVQEIEIEKEVVNPDDVEMLEDLVVAATNEALKKVQEMMKEELSKITGGFWIPDII